MRILSVTVQRNFPRTVFGNSNVTSSARGKLKVPTAYVGGDRSRESELTRLSFMKKHFPIDFYQIEGSHLFPLENPRLTAKMIESIAKC